MEKVETILKLEELRIGNLVFQKLRKDKEHSLKEVKYIGYDLAIEYLKMIEVTEEWLLKFGFEEFGNLFIHPESNVCVMLTDMVCKKGVHWFQNWYFFETGTELTLSK